MDQRWTDLTEISYDKMVDLAKMNAEGRDEIRQCLGYKKIVNTCSRLREMSMSGCGWTLAANQQVKQRITIRGYQFDISVVCKLEDMLRGPPCSSVASVIPFVPPIETIWSTPSRTAGRSGFRMGGPSMR